MPVINFFIFFINSLTFNLENWLIPPTSNPPCTNSIGQISKNIKRSCENGSIEIIYNATNQILDSIPKDTLIFFIYSDKNNPIGSTITHAKTLKIIKQTWMQFGVEYYVGVKLGRTDGKGDIDSLAGCFKYDYGTPFVFYEIPKPYAGPDESVCGSSYDLKGVQSIAGTKINWREKNGRNVFFSNTRDPNSEINIIDGFGTYCFILEEDNYNGLCVQEDEVCITFNPNPELINVIKYCTRDLGGLSSDDRYLVKVDITKGKPDYTLVIPPSTANGSIIGNQYFSDTLACLEDFIVVVRDANGCESQLLLDTYNCNCGTIDCGTIDAGSLDTSLISVCQDKCVPIANLIPETINLKEDIAMYVLHTAYANFLDPKGVLDTFYSINDVICFDPQTMKTGYLNSIFLTRIVGDDLNPKDGIVDVKDPCKRNSKPMQIIFEPNTNPIAGLDDTICGLKYLLNGKVTFGNSNWKLISGPGSTQIANPIQLQTTVQVSKDGIYNFELSGDKNTCKSLDTIQLVFSNPKSTIRAKRFMDKENEIITLYGSNSSSSNTSILYSWSTINGQFIQNSKLNDQNVQINKPGTYFLQVIDSISTCSSKTAFTVYKKINSTDKKENRIDSFLRKNYNIQKSNGTTVLGLISEDIRIKLENNSVVKFNLFDLSGRIILSKTSSQGISLMNLIDQLTISSGCYFYNSSFQFENTTFEIRGKLLVLN
ncbi:MAG: hypothetical protein ABI851_08235 [Saprospiraceae bacterium]